MCAFRLKLMLLCSMLLAPFASAAVPDVSLHLPLTFEQNGGQVAAPYRFTTRHGGVPASFREDGVDFAVPSRDGKSHLLRMDFPGATKSVHLQGEQALPGVANYLKGADPKAWHTALPTYGEIRYQELFPGVDLVFHGDAQQQELEHDFVLQPGSDLASVRFALQGADNAALDSQGELVVTVGDRRIVFHAPNAWQGSSAGRHAVPAHFAQLSPGVFGFRLGAYDHREELTIDPVLAFATYLDGSFSDTIQAITTDRAGNIYVTGWTFSTDFPLANPEQQSKHGSINSFVSKLDPSGHSLLYSTYLGGSNEDLAQSIAVDTSGNVVVSGVSSSRDFPAAGALSSTVERVNATYNFITSLTADGQTLRYSGFLGSTGAGSDGSNPRLNRVACDSQGAAYIAGLAQDDFPYTQGAYGGPPAGYPAEETLFVAKVLADGTLGYAATIPETPQQVPVTIAPRIDLGGLAVNSEGEVVLGGTAANNLLTTGNVLEASLPDDVGEAGYVLKLNATGTALVYSSYLPGADSVRGLALDAAENIFVAGVTTKTNLPTLPNAFQATALAVNQCNCFTGFVLKIKEDATQALAATYFSKPLANLRNSDLTYLADIALDNNGNVVVGGATTGGVPLADPLTAVDGNLNGVFGNSLLIAEFSPDLSRLKFATYLNAPVALPSLDTDYVSTLSAVAVTAQNRILVAGATGSTRFPGTAGAFQSQPPASTNTATTPAFLAGLDLSTPAGAACYATTNVSLPNQFVGTTGNTPIAVTNCGNAPLTLPALTSSDPTVAATHTCNGIAPGDSCQIQLAFTPTSTTSIYGVVGVAGSATLWPQQIAFHGAGGYPQVSPQSALSAPDALLGQVTQAYLPLYNTGTIPFVLQSVVATGDFQVDPGNCTQALAPNTLCSITVFFAPTATGARTGTLTLTDNLVSSTQLIQLTGQALTTAPVPTITSIPPFLQPASGDGSVVVFGTYFLPNSIVNWNGQPLATVNQGEQRLSATVPAALLQVGEASVTVSTPAPGGGTSNASVATVYGQLNIQVLHEVYSPVTGLLYATTDASSPLSPNSVVAIDPVRMQVTATLLTGNSPDQLAVADDGSLLYVGLDTPGAVAQIALPSGTVNFTATLPAGTDFDAGPKSTASALAVLPGQAHSWIVGLCSPNHNSCGEGIALFDDALQRPVTADNESFSPSSFAFLSDASNVYALDSSYGVANLSTAPTGLSYAARPYGTPLPYPGPLLSDGRQLFLDDGEVIDPAAFATSFRYPVTGRAFTLDVPNNRLFYITNDGSDGFFLTEVDKTTQAIGGRLQLPGIEGVTDLQRFGTQGLVLKAFTSEGTSNLFFLKSSLISNAAPPVQLSLSPAALTFPGQPQSTTSPPQSITVTNVSPSPVDIRGLSITGEFAQTNTCVGTLPSGGTCTISVTFSPSIPGSSSGQLTLGNSGNPSSLALPLTGTGLPAVVYQATLSPAALSFNLQTISTTSAPQTTTLTNTGTGDLTLQSLSVTGDFAQVNTCGSTLAVGASCNVTTTFTPTAKGTRTGTLTVLSNATQGPLLASLSGTGQEALTYTATLTPTSLTFAPQLLGTASPGQSVTLSNTGTGTLTLSGINVTGDFQQTSTCGGTLTAGASCNLVVSFQPTAAGIRAGALSITAKESSGPLSVALSGTGTAPLTYTATVSPGALTFGTQDIGASSSPQAVLLRNTGTASLTLRGVTVSGDFSQSGTCGGALAAGASCTINVTFTPTETGTRTGTLTLTDDASAGPQTITLTGNADLPLTLAPGTTGGNSATVTSGTTASYALALTPGAYSGPVALSCSGAPVNATCTPTPSTLTVSGGQSQAFNVTVTTQAPSQTAHTSFATRRPQLAAAGLLGILGLPLFLRRRHGRRTSIALGFVALACGTAIFTGCGGGSVPPSSGPAPQQVAPGTYTLTVTATANTFSATQALTLVVK